jgi:hypothetical protein
MQDFRKLDVWQNARQFALQVYGATGGMPPEERYGLTSQLRRAAMSIPANIAEDAVASPMPTSGGFSTTPWDPPPSLNPIS